MKSFAKGISEFGFFIIVTVVIRSGVGWERRKLMRKTIGRVLLMGSLLAAGGGGPTSSPGNSSTTNV
jgi:hypothetical protein